jgi:hypothetical protein
MRKSQWIGYRLVGQSNGMVGMCWMPTLDGIETWRCCGLEKMHPCELLGLVVMMPWMTMLQQTQYRKDTPNAQHWSSSISQMEGNRWIVPHWDCSSLSSCGKTKG